MAWIVCIRTRLLHSFEQTNIVQPFMPISHLNYDSSTLDRNYGSLTKLLFLNLSKYVGIGSSKLLLLKISI